MSTVIYGNADNMEQAVKDTIDALNKGENVVMKFQEVNTNPDPYVELEKDAVLFSTTVNLHVKLYTGFPITIIVGGSVPYQELYCDQDMTITWRYIQSFPTIHAVRNAKTNAAIPYKWKQSSSPPPSPSKPIEWKPILLQLGCCCSCVAVCIFTCISLYIMVAMIAVHGYTGPAGVAAIVTTITSVIGIILTIILFAVTIYICHRIRKQQQKDNEATPLLNKT